MEITGKISYISPLENVVFNNGEQSVKKTIIVQEINVEYPQSAAITFYGERAQQFVYLVEDKVNVHFSMRARNTEKGCFNELRGWRITASSIS